MKPLGGRVVINDGLGIRTCLVEAFPIPFGLEQFAGDCADRPDMFDYVLTRREHGPSLFGIRQSLPRPRQRCQDEPCVLLQRTETGEGRDLYVMAGSAQALAESHRGLDVSSVTDR